MKLDGIEWLIKMDWKNFEKDPMSFGAAYKKWWKNTCGRTACLETLRTVIIFQRFPYILREWWILQEKFCRYIQKYELFVWCIRLPEEVGKSTLKVLRKCLKIDLYEVHFIVDLTSFPVPLFPSANPSFPKVSHLSPPRQNNFQNSPLI